MSRFQLIGLCVLAALASACTKEVKLTTDAVSDRAAMPILDAGEVSTLISDSGVTRFRISAEKWQVYDKAEPTYWEFTKGIYLEKFNEELQIEASIRADYAKYLDQQGLWELKGHVHAMNEQGEEFDTEQLFWNQQTERVYSDVNITIKRPSSTIEGVGFNSNQTMTEYTILKPTGFIPVDNIDETSN